MLFCDTSHAWVCAGGDRRWEGGGGEKGHSPSPQWTLGWRQGKRQGAQRESSPFRDMNHWTQGRTGRVLGLQSRDSGLEEAGLGVGQSERLGWREKSTYQECLGQKGSRAMQSSHRASGERLNSPDWAPQLWAGPYVCSFGYCSSPGLMRLIHFRGGKG